MATQTEKEAQAMLSRVRFSFAGPLSAEEAGDTILRMAADIRRERELAKADRLWPVVETAT